MAIDDKIFKTSQAAYLWLFDRTGIYVGTVAMTVSVAAIFCLAMGGGGVGPGTIFALVVYGSLCMVRYYHQHAERYELYNRLSRIWHTGWMRTCCAAYWLGSFIADLALGRWLWAISSLLIIAFFNYVMCWQIRKREPPEKMVFVPQAAS